MASSTNHIVTAMYIICPITVSGVTFKNGRRSRQTILREIYWKDEPYDKVDTSSCVELVKTEFEGNPAVEVWVKSKSAREMIGYIPKSEASFFAEHLEDFLGITDFHVYGGGDHSYGCSFSARFANKMIGSNGEIPEEIKLFEQYKEPDNTSTHAIICKAFLRQYPHAMITGCQPDGEDSLLIFLAHKPSHIATYDAFSDVVSISPYDSQKKVSTPDLALSTVTPPGISKSVSTATADQTRKSGINWWRVLFAIIFFMTVVFYFFYSSFVSSAQ